MGHTVKECKFLKPEKSRNRSNLKNNNKDIIAIVSYVSHANAKVMKKLLILLPHFMFYTSS
ncbi:hypothetical protein CR513_28833, partial [Mucuna pruriens]